MIARAASAALSVGLAASLLAGCASDPAPAEPTPLFASEEEAFAAAEATYRAYVDALNHVDLSDPATFEDVYAWTTGDANSSARRTLSQMHGDGWTVTGETRISMLADRSAGPNVNIVAVEIDVCVDVSNVGVTNGDGDSIVDPERSDIQAMRISLVAVGDDPGRLLIADIDGREGPPACSG